MHNMEWWLGWVYLTLKNFLYRWKVDRAPEAPIVLPTDDHSIGSPYSTFSVTPGWHHVPVRSKLGPASATSVQGPSSPARRGPEKQGFLLPTLPSWFREASEKIVTNRGLTSSGEMQFKFRASFIHIFRPSDVNDPLPFPRPFPSANEDEIWQDDRETLYLLITGSCKRKCFSKFQEIMFFVIFSAFHTRNILCDSA